MLGLLSLKGCCTHVSCFAAAPLVLFPLLCPIKRQPTQQQQPAVTMRPTPQRMRDRTKRVSSSTGSDVRFQLQLLCGTANRQQTAAISRPHIDTTHVLPACAVCRVQAQP